MLVFQSNPNLSNSLQLSNSADFRLKLYSENARYSSYTFKFYENPVSGIWKHTQNTSPNSDTYFYVSYKRFSHAKDEPTSASVRCCDLS